MTCFVTVTHALDARAFLARPCSLWGAHMLMLPCMGTAYQAARGAQWVMENEVFIFIWEQQPQQADAAK